MPTIPMYTPVKTSTELSDPPGVPPVMSPLALPISRQLPSWACGAIPHLKASCNAQKKVVVSVHGKQISTHGLCKCTNMPYTFLPYIQERHALSVVLLLSKLVCLPLWDGLPQSTTCQTHFAATFTAPFLSLSSHGSLNSCPSKR